MWIVCGFCLCLVVGCLDSGWLNRVYCSLVFVWWFGFVCVVVLVCLDCRSRSSGVFVVYFGVVVW